MAASDAAGLSLQLTIGPISYGLQAWTRNVRRRVFISFCIPLPTQFATEYSLQPPPTKQLTPHVYSLPRLAGRLAERLSFPLLSISAAAIASWRPSPSPAPTRSSTHIPNQNETRRPKRARARTWPATVRPPRRSRSTAPPPSVKFRSAGLLTRSSRKGASNLSSPHHHQHFHIHI